MKLGSIKKIIIFCLIFFSNLSAEDRITTSPLINLEELKPSYEEEEISDNKKENNKIIIKEKKTNSIEPKFSTVNLLGLDKITAKTSKIKIKIGEVKNFGELEIKALKCGKIDYFNSTKDAAYIQVRDLKDTNNEKIFIFNGWTFSTDQNVSPIDHAIYDIWLTGCDKV
tara:strand:+ start:183 stop:689 length:507 start_codon:yes stop_codon:yes gene_type:complete